MDDRGGQRGPGDAAAQEGERPPRQDGDRWWRAFGDPALSSLVEGALASAPRVRVARARVARARSLAAADRARYFPRLDAEVSGSRSRQVASFPEELGSLGADGPDPPTDGTTGGVPETFESRRWSAELVGTFEPDLAGRTAGLARAAEHELAAARAEAEDTGSALAAEMARTWFEAIAIRVNRRVLAEEVELGRAQLALVRSRYEWGLAPALELAQQRTRLATTLSQAAALEGLAEGARRRLAVLAGAARAEDVPAPETERLPAPPPLPPTGVPADLLGARRDIVAARRRVQAADRRAGAAIAGFLPSIALQGSVGYGAERFHDIFQNLVWSGLIVLTQPLFAGGERFAQRDQARAAVEEALADYADTVAQAMVEVEDALAADRRARLQVRANEGRLEAADHALGQARERYERGLTDLTTVIQAEEALLGARLALLDTRQALLVARIDVHRALGGGALPEAAAGEPPARAPTREGRSPGRAPEPPTGSPAPMRDE